MLGNCDLPRGSCDVPLKYLFISNDRKGLYMIAAQSSPFKLAHATPDPGWDYVSTGTPQVLGWHDLLEHRDYMIRFAKRKLRVSALAEDIVHDVFVAVISGKASFLGKSALRSWLTAVLKNKIIDTIRQCARYDTLDANDGDDSAPEIACDLAGPEQLVQHREALRQTLQRIEQLPVALRDVIHLRVLREASTEDVCKKLKITKSSLFVRLHRARQQLQC